MVRSSMWCWVMFCDLANILRIFVNFLHILDLTAKLPCRMLHSTDWCTHLLIFVFLEIPIASKEWWAPWLCRRGHCLKLSHVQCRQWAEASRGAGWWVVDVFMAGSFWWHLSDWCLDLFYWNSTYEGRLRHMQWWHMTKTYNIFLQPGCLKFCSWLGDYRFTCLVKL